jgi:broad specificity phosphatase PhoE
VTTTVYLVRHGAHDRLGNVLCGRMAGVALNDDGVAQAQAAAKRLGGRGVAAVYASPVQRAWQTAAAIGEALACPVSVDEGLSEIDFGDWSGKAFEELGADPDWAVWNTARGEARPPGGESMAEARDRVIGFLDRVREAHPDEAVVAVSHADVIKAALLQVLGLALQAYGRIEVDPGSISVIVTGAWGAKVHSINEAIA